MSMRGVSCPAIAFHLSDHAGKSRAPAALKGGALRAASLSPRRFLLPLLCHEVFLSFPRSVIANMTGMLMLPVYFFFFLSWLTPGVVPEGTRLS